MDDNQEKRGSDLVLIPEILKEDGLPGGRGKDADIAESVDGRFEGGRGRGPNGGGSGAHRGSPPDSRWEDTAAKAGDGEGKGIWRRRGGPKGTRRKG